MNKAQQLIGALDEFMGFERISPFDAAVHKATHSLVHNDAMKTAEEHAEKFRLAMQDKGLAKSYVNGMASKIKRDAYNKHYRKAYTSTKREVRDEMSRQD